MTKKIEDEIKTVNFRSEFHKATLNIIFTSGWLSGIHAEIFKKYNLTSAQYNVLRILRGNHPNPLTLLSIRDRMLDKMSDVSRIIERLRIAGLAERFSCESDRRAVDINITEKGLQLLKQMESEEEKMDSFLNNLTAEEAQQLNILLDKIRD